MDSQANRQPATPANLDAERPLKAARPGIGRKDGLTTDNGRDGDAHRAEHRAATRALADTFIDERDDVLAVINELEDQIDRYEDIRAGLERQINEQSEQLQTARQKTQELEWQTVTLQTRVEAAEQVRRDVALLEEEIADGNIRLQRATEQLSTADKENARLTEEVKTLTKQSEELWPLRKERDGLRVDVKNLRGKAEQLDRAHRDAVEERASTHAKLQETQAQAEELRSGKHQAEVELRASEDRTAELRRAQEGLEQKLEAMRTEKRTVQAQIVHLERENARLIEQQQFYECELTSVRSLNRNTEAALTNVKKAFSEVRLALAETKSRARRRTGDPISTIGTRAAAADHDGVVTERSATASSVMPQGEPRRPARV